MSARYWLISDGTVKRGREIVPSGQAFAVVIWDGETEWTPPKGSVPEHEDAAKANGRVMWAPTLRATPAKPTP